MQIEPKMTDHQTEVCTQHLTDSINTFQMNNEPHKRISIVTYSEHAFKSGNILAQLVKRLQICCAFSLKGPFLWLKLLSSRPVQVK